MTAKKGHTADYVLCSQCNRRLHSFDDKVTSPIFYLGQMHRLTPLFIFYCANDCPSKNSDSNRASNTYLQLANNEFALVPIELVLTMRQMKIRLIREFHLRDPKFHLTESEAIKINYFI